MAVYCQAVDTNNYFLLTCNSGTNTGGATGVPTAAVKVSGTETDMWGQQALSTGTWYHYAITFDGTRASFYLNGVCVSGLQAGTSNANFVPSQLGTTAQR
jgi:hypothetical protein